MGVALLLFATPALSGLAGDVLEAPMAVAEQQTTCSAHAPIDVGLVIDESGSMSGSRIATAKQGAIDLVAQLGLADQSGLTSYDSTAVLRKALSPDHLSTQAAISSLSAGGFTAMGAGIDVSHDDFLVNGRAAAVQVMIVLTDGFTNTGPDPVTEADQAKADGIEIYAIGVGGSINTGELQAVASSPDHFFHAQTAEEIADVFAEIGATILLASSQALSYGVTLELNVPNPASEDPLAIGEDTYFLLANQLGRQYAPDGGSGTYAEEPIVVPGTGLELSFSTIVTSASNEAGVSRASAHGVATLEDVLLTYNGMELLSAEALRAEATSEATAGPANSYDFGTRMTKLRVADQPVLIAGFVRNVELTLPDELGRVVINEQEEIRTNGATALLINLVHAYLSLPGGEEVELILSSVNTAANCLQPEGAGSGVEPPLGEEGIFHNLPVRASADPEVGIGDDGEVTVDLNLEVEVIL